MVRVTGPLCSTAASGPISHTLSYGRTAGRNWARTRLDSVQTLTAPQVATRAMFGFLSAQWPHLSAPAQQSWDPIADTARLAPGMSYRSANLIRWQQFRGPGQAWPIGDTGVLPVATLSAVLGGVAHVTYRLLVTTLNDCWGALLFTHRHETYTPTRSMCVGVIPLTHTGFTYWELHNLAPGKYCCKAIYFTRDGLKSAPTATKSAYAR